MKELNALQMEQVNGGNKAACGSIGIFITIISITNPIAGAAAGIMWAGACWWLG